MASSASPAKRARDEAAGAGAGSGAGPDDSDATGPRGEASLWAVCVDGSDHSTTALQWAIDHMQRDEDQLLLLTVVEGVECRVCVHLCHHRSCGVARGTSRHPSCCLPAS